MHSLSKSDDQERTQFLKMGVKEWAHSFFFLMSESWAKLKKLMSVEHVDFYHQFYTLFGQNIKKWIGTNKEEQFF